MLKRRETPNHTDFWIKNGEKDLKTVDQRSQTVYFVKQK